MKKIFADIIIIGAGPAGMAAALKAGKMGIKNILIIDRMPEPGGILQQCIHNGFGLHKFKKDLTGPEFANHYISKLGRPNIKVMLHTMATELTRDGKVIISNDTDGLVEVTPKAIILAMGCRERTRQQVSIPGTRPSGIFTAGVAQRFMNIEGYMPGKEVVVVGSGDIGMIMARRMTMEGAKVHAVTEILPYPGGLSRNVVQCLNDFDIPLYLQHGVVEIRGRDRVSGVKIAKLDQAGNPTNQTFDIDCDTLLFSVGLIPENELSRMIPLELSPITGGPFIDDNYQTSREGVFTCGNAAFVNDLADYACMEGEIAGEAAANYVNDALSSEFNMRVVAGCNLRFAVPNFLTGKAPVTLYMRVTQPMVDVKITSTDNIVNIKQQIVKPSEMIEVTLDKAQLAKIKELKEFRIGVTPR